eukprot:CAMPEP_0116057616 /NCGR_PEP_ID=MMETSP0322-20121206/4717_1 /TAXON_ID=163516 /ORGANISM="Leptocylindrus danicus var. apora, Strain B651" /LENGTH=341 /DNA_ID=CAMNT_0003541661 /DNA_START=9 /DNA_END=1030 /DNA_ORIENTATION=-
MANNGNRQANAAPMNEHVEFTVKAAEDLYLEGSENTIRRVVAETNYSCLMLKTQRFSSLFRHYAKYHGLRKDDLEYCFVNALEGDDTPETVQLQRGDTIMVRKKRKPEPPAPTASDGEFVADFRDLLDDHEHKDSTLEIQEDGSKIRAHKAILTARSDYFRSAFRKNTFGESENLTLKIPNMFKAFTIQKMLEFIYTNRVECLSNLTIEQLLGLLHCAEYYVLRDLKKIVEHCLISKMDVTNVARLYCATEDYSAKRLAQSCIQFIMDHIREVTNDENFTHEMRNYPNLCIPVLQEAAKLIPEGPAAKKPRLLTSISSTDAVAHQHSNEASGNRRAGNTVG